MGERENSVSTLVNEKFEEYEIENQREIDEEVIEEIIDNDDQAMANILMLGLLNKAQGETDAWMRLLSEFALPDEVEDTPNYCPNCGEEL